MPLSTAANTFRLPAGSAGRVITATDSDYDKARTVMYGGHDKRPAQIVRVADAADTVTAIAYARDNRLELAVRSGGHSAAGHSTTHGGLVIDVRDLKGIDIDAANRTVWVGAGVTAGALTEALAPHQLIVGFGDAGTVGVSGITLASATWRESTACRSTPCSPSNWSPPMAGNCWPTRPTIPNCSGPCVAAAAISASSPG